MRVRTLASTIVGALLIALLLWLGAYAYENIELTPAGAAPASAVSSLALHVGEQAAIDGFTMKLLQINSDSRCPRGAVCIWSGEVAVAVEFASGVNKKTAELSSAGSTYAFAGHEIAVVGVGPMRVGTPPAQNAYRITFAVREL